MTRHISDDNAAYQLGWTIEAIWYAIENERLVPDPDDNTYVTSASVDELHRWVATMRDKWYGESIDVFDIIDAYSRQAQPHD